MQLKRTVLAILFVGVFGVVYGNDDDILKPLLMVRYDTEYNPLTGVNPFKIGSDVYFHGYDKLHGVELWKTDGTSSGTHIVKDIIPGPLSSISQGSHIRNDITQAGSHIYFEAKDVAHGTELWKTDGTSSGTMIVTDYIPGPNSGLSVTSLIPMGSNLLIFNLARPILTMDISDDPVTFQLSTGVFGKGVIELFPTRPRYVEGSTLTLSAEPESGHQFAFWSGDVPPERAGENPLVILMDKDKVIRAYFHPVNHTLMATTNGYGMVSLNPGQGWYAKGTPVTITATAFPGFVFQGWYGDVSDDVKLSPQLTIIMDSDKTVHASFARAVNRSAVLTVR